MQIKANPLSSNIYPSINGNEDSDYSKVNLTDHELFSDEHQGRRIKTIGAVGNNTFNIRRKTEKYSPRTGQSS